MVSESKRIELLQERISKDIPLDLSDLNFLINLYSIIDDLSERSLFTLSLSKRLKEGTSRELIESLLQNGWEELSPEWVRIPWRRFFETYEDLILDFRKAYLDDGYIVLSRKIFEGSLVALYMSQMRVPFFDIPEGSLEAILQLIRTRPPSRTRGALSSEDNLERFRATTSRVPRSTRTSVSTSKTDGTGKVPEVSFPRYIVNILELLKEGSTELKHFHWFFVTRYLLNAGYSEAEVHRFLRRSPLYSKPIAAPQVSYIAIRHYGPPSLSELKSNGLITDEEALYESNLFPRRPKSKA